MKILMLLPIAFLIAACGSKEAGPPGPLALEKLGLTITAPGGSTVRDAMFGDGVSVQLPGVVVDVAKATGSTPETIAAAKDENRSYRPTNIEEETLTDGWALSFQNRGGAGRNFWVQVRRDIGGEAYWCTTTAQDAEAQAAALEACKSLTK